MENDTNIDELLSRFDEMTQQIETLQNENKQIKETNARLLLRITDTQKDEQTTKNKNTISFKEMITKIKE